MVHVCTLCVVGHTLVHVGIMPKHVALWKCHAFLLVIILFTLVMTSCLRIMNNRIKANSQITCETKLSIHNKTN